MNLETGRQSRTEQLDGRLGQIEAQLGESNEETLKRLDEMKGQVGRATRGS